MLLIFTSAPREGSVVQLSSGRLTIGRVAANDLQLDDEKVSRHHAVIEVQDRGSIVLRDLGSRNGTYVDGQRLSGPRVLSGGEQLRFGDQQLRVEAAVAQPAGVPAAAAVSRSAGSRPAGPKQEGELEPAAVGQRAQPARSRRRTRLLALGALVLLALVGIAQLVLPGAAEDRLRSQLGRYGVVRKLHISSTPAIKLLWHRADSVEVVMDSYRSEPGGHGSLADFLSRTRDTGKLDVSVGTLHAQLVTLHDVRLRKEGDALLGQARLTQSDLSAALPTFLDLRPVSASQNGIVVSVSAAVFGQRVGAHLGVLAEAGRVVVRPEGLPFGSLATITVFADPRVYIESLGAELRGQDYLLTARARLQ